MTKLREECGVFGIFDAEEASVLTTLGLHSLQHRGQEGAGIVSYNGKKFYNIRKQGLVGDNFNNNEVLSNLPGRHAIGHVRYSTTGESKAENLDNSQNIENLSNQLNERGYSIDILINNAGVTRDNLFLRMKEDEWSYVTNINLHSTVFLTQKIIKGMIKRKSGRILFITSIIGHSGNPGQSNYSASKAGLAAFSKSIASEVASRGITVNCIAPGFIKTPMTDKLSEDQQNQILKNIPASRFGLPSDVASACIYLSSDEASFVTGSTIHVNGGMGMF